MRKHTFAGVCLAFLSSNAISQWNYGEQPFATSPPYLSTLGSAVQNKIPVTYMYDSLTFPYPTNSWFMNAILKQGTFPSFNYDPARQDVGAERIYGFPYIIRALPLPASATYTELFGFGYITPAYEFSRHSWTPGDSTDQIN